MKTNALSVANYFIRKGLEEKRPVKPLKLMKLVYIAYGYALAMLDKRIIDPRFDCVEAWRYGPVIPSVYHSFKHYRDSAVTEETVVMEDGAGSVSFVQPVLEDSNVQALCDYIWRRYGSYSDSELVTLLHGSGTPWGMVYEEGRNRIIPEFLTKQYYKGLVEYLKSLASNDRA